MITLFCFFNDPSTTEIYTLALHDALPIYGWDERNGGNVSLRLTDADLQDFNDINEVHRVLDLGFDAQKLAGQYFLVTGTGRYFRNVIDQPNLDLGLIRISQDGQKGELMWGFEDGGQPTSEFPSHLMSHIARLQFDSHQRVVIDRKSVV